MFSGCEWVRGAVAAHHMPTYGCGPGRSSMRWNTRESIDTIPRRPSRRGRFKVLNLIHKAVLRVTGGRWSAHAFGMPAVELHTTGRKSGQRRTVILTSPIHDDSGWSWSPPRAATTATRTGTEPRGPARRGDHDRREDPPLPGPHGEPGGAGGDVARVVRPTRATPATRRRPTAEIPVVICEPLARWRGSGIAGRAPVCSPRLGGTIGQ